MDLTRDELAMLASVYYYPIHERASPMRHSSYNAIVRPLVEYGLVAELWEKCEPFGPKQLTGVPRLTQYWVLRVTEKGKGFFESLSTFDRAIASRNAGLFHTMGKLIELLPIDRLPFFLSAEVPFVQERASKRLAELSGEIEQIK